MINLAPGVRLGGYQMLDIIGRTGMSEVWRAQDESGRIVAFKTISRRASDDVQLQERFLREGGEQRELNHPSIVPILDFFEQDGGLYLVMEYLSGGSLEDVLESRGWRPLPIPEALSISSQILSALDYAHRRLIVHRDVKPSNILLHEGRAYLGDFGIALALGRPRLTTFSQVLGTRCYMSPEQIVTPLDVTHLTDVYSFGCVLYEMLTGRQPYPQDENDPDGPFATYGKRVTDPPVLPRQVNPDIPLRLERIVLTSLAAVPQNRFSGCASFQRALEAFADDYARTTSLPVSGPAQPFVEKAMEPVVLPCVQVVQIAAPSDPVTTLAPVEEVSVGGNVVAAAVAGMLWIPFVPEQNYPMLALSIVASGIVFLRILFKGWQALPPGNRRTTPWKSIGFLFIPFFNLAWMWIAVVGFALDFNRYIRKLESPPRSQNPLLYGAFCLLQGYALPIAILSENRTAIVWLAAVNGMILVPIMVGAIARAINQLPAPAEASLPAAALRTEKPIP